MQQVWEIYKKLKVNGMKMNDQPGNLIFYQKFFDERFWESLKIDETYLSFLVSVTKPQTEECSI